MYEKSNLRVSTHAQTLWELVPSATAGQSLQLANKYKHIQREVRGRTKDRESEKDRRDSRVV